MKEVDNAYEDAVTADTSEPCIYGLDTELSMGTMTPPAPPVIRAMRGAIIEIIEHASQRYPTVGDWYEQGKGGAWRIKVSRMGDWRYELLVAVHELVEMALCQARGIAEVDVTAFDTKYESYRRAHDASEPGDSPKAPYHKEHQFASHIERQVAWELGIDWATYEATVEAL